MCSFYWRTLAPDNKSNNRIVVHDCLASEQDLHKVHNFSFWPEDFGADNYNQHTKHTKSRKGKEKKATKDNTSENNSGTISNNSVYTKAVELNSNNNNGKVTDNIKEDKKSEQLHHNVNNSKQLISLPSSIRRVPPRKILLSPNKRLLLIIGVMLKGLPHACLVVYPFIACHSVT